MNISDLSKTFAQLAVSREIVNGFTNFRPFEVSPQYIALDQSQVEEQFDIILTTLISCSKNSDDAAPLLDDLTRLLGSMTEDFMGYSPTTPGIELGSFTPQWTEYIKPGTDSIARVIHAICSLFCGSSLRAPVRPISVTIEVPDELPQILCRVLGIRRHASFYWASRCLTLLCLDKRMDLVADNLVSILSNGLTNKSTGQQEYFAQMVTGIRTVTLSSVTRWLRRGRTVGSPYEVPVQKIMQMLEKVTSIATHNLLRTQLLFTVDQIIHAVLPPKLFTRDELLISPFVDALRTSVANIVVTVSGQWATRKFKSQVLEFIIHVAYLVNLRPDMRMEDFLRNTVVEQCELIIQDQSKEVLRRKRIADLGWLLFVPDASYFEAGTHQTFAAQAALETLLGPREFVPPLTADEVVDLTKSLQMSCRMPRFPAILRSMLVEPRSKASTVTLALSLAHITPQLGDTPRLLLDAALSILTCSSIPRSPTQTVRGRVFDEFSVQTSSSSDVNTTMALAALTLIPRLLNDLHDAEDSLTASAPAQFIRGAQTIISQGGHSLTAARVIFSALTAFCSLGPYANYIHALDCASAMLVGLDPSQDTALVRLVIDFIHATARDFQTRCRSELLEAESEPHLGLELQEVSRLWSNTAMHIESALLYWVVIVDGRRRFGELLSDLIGCLRLVTLPEFRLLQIAAQMEHMHIASYVVEGFSGGPIALYRQWYASPHPMTAAAVVTLSLCPVMIADILPTLTSEIAHSAPLSIAAQIVTSECPGRQGYAPFTCSNATLGSSVDKFHLPVVPQTALLALNEDTDCTNAECRLLTTYEQSSRDILTDPTLVAFDMAHMTATRLMDTPALDKENALIDLLEGDQTAPVGSVPPHSIMPHLSALLEVLRIGGSDSRFFKAACSLKRTYMLLSQYWTATTKTFSAQVVLSPREFELIPAPDDCLGPKLRMALRPWPDQPLEVHLLWSAILHFLCASVDLCHNARDVSTVGDEATEEPRLSEFSEKTNEAHTSPAYHAVIGLAVPEPIMPSPQPLTGTQTPETQPSPRHLHEEPRELDDFAPPYDGLNSPYAESTLRDSFVHDRDYAQAFEGRAEAPGSDELSFQDGTSDFFSFGDGPSLDSVPPSSDPLTSLDPGAHESPHPELRLQLGSTPSAEPALPSHTDFSLPGTSRDTSRGRGAKLATSTLSGRLLSTVMHLLSIASRPVVVTTIAAVGRLQMSAQETFCDLMLDHLSCSAAKGSRADVARKVRQRSFSVQTIFSLAVLSIQPHLTPRFRSLAVAIVGVWLDTFVPLPPHQAETARSGDHRARAVGDFESPLLSLLHPPQAAFKDLGHGESTVQQMPSINPRIINYMPLYWPRTQARLPLSALTAMLVIINMAAASLRLIGSDAIDTLAALARLTPRLPDSEQTITQNTTLSIVPTLSHRLFLLALALDSAPASDDACAVQPATPAALGPCACTIEYWMRPVSQLSTTQTDAETEWLESFTPRSLLRRSPRNETLRMAEDVSFIDALASVSLSLPQDALPAETLMAFVSRLVARGPHVISACSKLVAAQLISQSGLELNLVQLICSTLSMPSPTARLPHALPTDVWYMRSSFQLQLTEVLCDGISRALLTSPPAILGVPSSSAFVVTSSNGRVQQQLASLRDALDDAAYLRTLGCLSAPQVSLEYTFPYANSVAALLWFVSLTLASPFQTIRSRALTLAQGVFDSLAHSFSVFSPIRDTARSIAHDVPRPHSGAPLELVASVQQPQVVMAMICLAPAVLASLKSDDARSLMLGLLARLFRTLGPLLHMGGGFDKVGATEAVDALLGTVALALQYGNDSVTIPGSAQSGPLRDNLEGCVAGLFHVCDTELLDVALQRCVEALTGYIDARYADPANNEAAVRAYHASAFVVRALIRLSPGPAVQQQLEALLGLSDDIRDPFLVLAQARATEADVRRETAALLYLDLVLWCPRLLTWETATRVTAVLTIGAMCDTIATVTVGALLGMDTSVNADTVAILRQTGALLASSHRCPSVSRGNSGLALLPSLERAWAEYGEQRQESVAAQHCLLHAVFLGTLVSSFGSGAQLESVATMALAYALRSPDQAVQASALDLFFATAALGMVPTEDHLCALGAIVLHHCGANPATTLSQATQTRTGTFNSAAAKAAAWLHSVLSLTADSVVGTSAHLTLFTRLAQPPVACLPPTFGALPLETVAGLFRLIGFALYTDNDSAIVFVTSLLDAALGVSARLESGRVEPDDQELYGQLTRCVAAALLPATAVTSSTSKQLTDTLNTVYSSGPASVLVAGLVLAGYTPFWSQASLIAAAELLTALFRGSAPSSDLVSATSILFCCMGATLLSLLRRTSAGLRVRTLVDIYMARVRRLQGLLGPGREGCVSAYDALVSACRGHWDEKCEAQETTFVDSVAQAVMCCAGHRTVLGSPPLAATFEVLTVCASWSGHVTEEPQNLVARPISLCLLARLSRVAAISGTPTLAARIASVARLLPPGGDQASLLSSVNQPYVGRHGRMFREPPHPPLGVARACSFMVGRVAGPAQVVERMSAVIDAAK